MADAPPAATGVPDSAVARPPAATGDDAAPPPSQSPPQVPQQQPSPQLPSHALLQANAVFRSPPTAAAIARDEAEGHGQSHRLPQAAPPDGSGSAGDTEFESGGTAEEARLRAQVKALRAALTEQSQANEAVARQMEELKDRTRRDVEEARDRHRSLQQKYDKLTDARNAYRGETQKLEAEAQSLRDELAAARERVAKLDALRVGHLNEITQLRQVADAAKEERELFEGLLREHQRHSRSRTRAAPAAIGAAEATDSPVPEPPPIACDGEGDVSIASADAAALPAISGRGTGAIPVASPRPPATVGTESVAAEASEQREPESPVPLPAPVPERPPTEPPSEPVQLSATATPRHGQPRTAYSQPPASLGPSVADLLALHASGPIAATTAPPVAAPTAAEASTAAAAAAADAAAWKARAHAQAVKDVYADFAWKLALLTAASALSLLLPF